MKSKSTLNSTFGGGRSLLFLIFVMVSLVLFFSELLEKSMFIDGVWYAVISRNLAEGAGSFWFPQFSATIFSNFHEHPPLVFGLQAFFFKLFGDHLYTERLFCFLHYCLTLVLMVKIWKRATADSTELARWWIIPLLLWQVNLVTYYFQPANLLDATIALLGLLSIWFMMKALDVKRALPWLLLAGFTLTVALLSKGLVALFPLAFFAIYGWVNWKETSFLKMIAYSLIVGIGLLMSLALVLLFIPAAGESLSQYVDIQLLASLKGERRLYYYRTSRFYILGQLLIVLVPMAVACLATWVLWRFSKRETSPRVKILIQSPPQTVYLFIGIGLSASLPIMISPRQAIPYLLPSIPFFSLAFGLWLAPTLVHVLEWVQVKWSKGFYLLRQVAYLGVIAAIVFCGLKWGDQNDRDAATIGDAILIGEQVGKEQVISSTTYNMYISGYLMRYDKISLDTNTLDRPYLLSLKDNVVKDTRYTKIPLPTQQYDLYTLDRGYTNKTD